VDRGEWSEEVLAGLCDGVFVYAGAVKIACRVSCLFLLAAACTRLVAEDDSDAWVMLKPAFAKLFRAPQSKTRFTYYDLNHLQNFDEKGKKFVDTRELFEVTYIGDLQYSRLVEVGGKPLSDRDLKKEQKRYDEAVRDHSALDDNARAKIHHREMRHLELNLNDFPVRYRSSMAGHADMGGRDCVLIDATPLADAPERHFRVWVDSTKGEVVRMETTLLADQGEHLGGTILIQNWIYIDDVPLVSQSHIDGVVRFGKKRIRVVSDHDYSRFRKFSVSTTILPVEP
jgi:hypothetical protein